MSICFINSSLFQGPESERGSCLPLSACVSGVQNLQQPKAEAYNPKIYMYVNTFLYLSQIEALFMKGG